MSSILVQYELKFDCNRGVKKKLTWISCPVIINGKTGKNGKGHSRVGAFTHGVT